MSQPVLPDPPGADEPFYIGYDPPMPGPIARVVRPAVIASIAIVLTGAALLALRHHAIGGGTFAFGQVEAVAGVIVQRPYPALRVAGRPASMLLVAPGKHGAAPLVRGLADRAVVVHGQRISRDGHDMLEISSVSETRLAGGRPEQASADASGASPRGERITLVGEIVDSKCFLGVMTPGQGQTHRACASLCLRGGIPPALFVEDRAGASRLMLLVSPDGDALEASTVAARAFEPTEMTGTLSRKDGWWVLRTDPARWRRLD